MKKKLNIDSSVIILNWNRKKEVLALLKELQNQTFHKFETIVVDNASTDGSAEIIKKRFPKVRVILLEKNFGKAGFNYGMREAEGDYLIMFDSDARPHSNVVEKYIERLKESKEIGLVCPAVYTSDGKYFGPAYNPGELKSGGADVLFFCGTSVAAKKKVFEKIGGYEERFFMCLEELEWATRARMAGYKVMVFPGIKVTNQQSVVGGDYRKRLGFYYTRNWVWYYAKYLPVAFWPNFVIRHTGSVRFRAGKEMSMKYDDIFKGLVAGLLGIGGFIRERVVMPDKVIKEMRQNVFIGERVGWKEGVSTEKRER